MLKNVNADSCTIDSPNPIDGSHNLMIDSLISGYGSQSDSGFVQSDDNMVQSDDSRNNLMAIRSIA